MSAFTPPTNADWCPDCQRERVDCSHQDDDDAQRLTTDGGQRLDAAEAVERVKDAHPHLLGLASAAADGDPADVERHADALREAVDDVEAAITGGEDA